MSATSSVDAGRSTPAPSRSTASGSASHPSAHAAARSSSRARRALPLLALVLPVLLVIVWQLGVSTGTFKTAITSTPGQVVATFFKLATNGVLLEELLSTVSRIAWGFGIGLAAGLSLGILTGYARTADRAIDPSVRALNAVPAVGWIPFLILALGIGDASKIALIALATFFPIYVNTYAGIRGTDQKLMELAGAYRLPRSRIIRNVVVPAALPQILVGVRIAVAISWVVATVSEILYGNTGLGVLLNDGRSLAMPDQMITVMIVLAILGKSSDMVVVAIQRRLTSWQSTLEGMAPHRARVVAARGRA
ncbi:MAG: ABC transporter permease [Chloroflexi bacterium]|nr:ABC transporter permease [Chloroflexota bacterium]